MAEEKTKTLVTPPDMRQYIENSMVKAKCSLKPRFLSLYFIT